MSIIHLGDRHGHAYILLTRNSRQIVKHVFAGQERKKKWVGRVHNVHWTCTAAIHTNHMDTDGLTTELVAQIKRDQTEIASLTQQLGHATSRAYVLEGQLEEAKRSNNALSLNLQRSCHLAMCNSIRLHMAGLPDGESDYANTLDRLLVTTRYAPSPPPSTRLDHIAC